MIERLIELGLEGVDQWRKELDRSKEDPGQVDDIQAQGRFALDFAERGMAVRMNPMGGVGPDLLLIASNTYVEVLRLRPRETDLPKEVKGDVLANYGAENASGTVGSRIDEKFKQSKNLPSSSSYLVAIRSDSDTFEDVELEIAVSDMRKEATSGGATRPWLGGVLFNDGQIRVRDGTGWMLWENANAAQPLPITIRNTLNARPV